METYNTACPDCGGDGQLEVISGSFAAKGILLKVTGPAYTEFEQITPSGEFVKCKICGSVFRLRDFEVKDPARWG